LLQSKITEFDDSSVPADQNKRLVMEEKTKENDEIAEVLFTWQELSGLMHAN